MSENKVKPLSSLILIENDFTIDVEMSQKELLELMDNKEPYIKIVSVDNVKYVIPKMVIKYIASDE